MSDMSDMCIEIFDSSGVDDLTRNISTAKRPHQKDPLINKPREMAESGSG